MRYQGCDRRVLRALSSTLKALNLVETLERRQHLHAGHDHGHDESLPHVHEGQTITVDQVDAILANPNGGHIPASTFVQAHPELAGRDIWAPEVFNPNNSTNMEDWLYDPHRLEDDMADYTFPAASGVESPEVPALPDLIPLSAGVNPFISTTEIPGHTLIRFTTSIGNQGAGPAILRSSNTGTPPAGSGISSWVNADGTQNVLQQLYSYSTPGVAGGTYSFESYRPAGRMTYHANHGHFHLEGYARYRLLTNVGGQPGPVAIRSGYDGSEATGDKVGFCLVNILSTFTLPGSGQSSNTLPGWSSQGSQGQPSSNGQPATSCGFVQGIHTGRADVYDSVYDGQWIDATGVPTGSYFIEISLDAQNVIQESNETNNTILIPFNLNTSPAPGGIQPDRFEPNNSFAEATDLGVLGIETQPGLTAHISSESDYFTWIAASSGSYTVQLTVADRDMNLSVYDANQTLLGQSSSPLSGTTAFPVGETVTVNFVAGQRYYAKAQAFGSDLNPTTSAVSNNYAFKVNVNPTVNASETDNTAAETGLEAGSVTVARNGPVSAGLTVNFSVSGTATRGVDYELYADDVPVLGNTVSIGAEASSIPLEVRPLGDSEVEAAETVIITVTGSSAYVVGGPSSGTITIADTPPAVTADAFKFEALPIGVSFDFSLNVAASLQESDLSVVLDGPNTPLAVTGVSYDGGLNRGTFTFNGVPADGNYTATLSGAGVTHALGAPLAGDEVVNFFVFVGHADRNRTIDIDDFSILALNFNEAGVYSDGDFDYNGTVDIDDFSILALKFNTALPAARPSGVLPGSGDSEAVTPAGAAAMPPRNAFASGLKIERVFDEIAEDTSLPL